MLEERLNTGFDGETDVLFNTADGDQIRICEATALSFTFIKEALQVSSGERSALLPRLPSHLKAH